MRLLRATKSHNAVAPVSGSDTGDFLRRRRVAPSPGIYPANSRHFLLFRLPLYCALCSLLIINTNEIPLFYFYWFSPAAQRSPPNRAASINSRRKPAIDARNITLPIPGSAPVIIRKPNTGRRRPPPRAMAMHWRCWRSSKFATLSRRTIRRPASWRKKPSRSAVNPGRSFWRGCW